MQQQERGREKEVMVYTAVHHCQHQQQKQRITNEISRTVSLGAWLKLRKSRKVPQSTVTKTPLLLHDKQSRTVSRGLRLPANTLPASDAVNLKIRMTLQIKWCAEVKQAFGTASRDTLEQTNAGEKYKEILWIILLCRRHVKPLRGKIGQSQAVLCNTEKKSSRQTEQPW